MVHGRVWLVFSHLSWLKNAKEWNKGMCSPWGPHIWAIWADSIANSFPAYSMGLESDEADWNLWILGSNKQSPLHGMYNDHVHISQLNTLITGNFCSPGIEGSQCLIRQVPLNLVLFKSYGQGEYASVNGIEGFGNLGGVRWVKCWFYSFSIFTYLFHSFLHHFPINLLHSICPLAGLRPIFTLYDFHVLF